MCAPLASVFVHNACVCVWRCTAVTARKEKAGLRDEDVLFSYTRQVLNLEMLLRRVWVQKARKTSALNLPLRLLSQKAARPA